MHPRNPRTQGRFPLYPGAATPSGEPGKTRAATTGFPPVSLRPGATPYCVVAPAATQAAITARSWSVIWVTFPSGIIRVTTVC